MAIISATPFVVSVIVIWGVATAVLHVDVAAAALRTEGLSGFGDALGDILSAPDVYLWIYLLFAIGNTMMPRWEDLKGARILLIGAGVAAVVLFLLGILNQVLNNGILTPSWRRAQSAVVGVRGRDRRQSVMAAALGVIESIFERITGDSATFRDGKMIAMTRAERWKRRACSRDATPKRGRRSASASPPPAVPPSDLPLPAADPRRAGA